MSFHIIIPARYASSRFEGKVLADIAGKSMLQRVFDVANQTHAESVVIATEDKRVKEVAETFGATVCMTSEDHESGTERITEVIELLDYDDDDIIVGLQADEPFIPADVINQLAADLAEHTNVKVASLCTPIHEVSDIFNPNVTKVVLNQRKYAMYFSRAPIPWERGNFSENGNQVMELKGEHFRHIGIYAYRASFLPQYLAMDTCELEKMELLEQLRILWQCGRIHMSVVKQAVALGIDTKEDLARAIAHFRN